MENKNKSLIIINLSIFLIVVFLIFYLGWKNKIQKRENSRGKTSGKNRK